MKKAFTTSKRVLDLRQTLIKQLPKFPNDRETLKLLQEKSLGELLIDYFAWAVRHVPQRARKVDISPEVLNDPRWEQHKAGAQILFEKVEVGSDITPHLSTEPHTRGFTPRSSSKTPCVDRWEDKDFLLLVMGFHHFHLGTELDENGYVDRTGVVLFAYVSRTEFEAIALFDHSVFDTSLDGSMTGERAHLWRIFDERVMKNASPGAVIVPTLIATSGHPIWLVKRASHCAHIIRELDPLLDAREYVKGLYEEAGLQPPNNPKMKWRFWGLELGVTDQKQHIFFSVLKSHI